MEAKPTIYIFHGYGGENSLMPLANHMQSKNYEILILDDQKFPYQRHEMIQTLDSLKKSHDIVFLTSEHLWFDRQNYQNIYWTDNSMLSALELMNFLSPKLSLFYPHDVECFMHGCEMRWAGLFDYILLPYKNNDYYRLKNFNPNVEIVGWIKKASESAPKIIDTFEPYSPVFFPSNIITFYQTLGAEGYADWFLKYISPSIPLKMPASDDGVFPILSERGYTFLPSSRSVYDVMAEHNLIIASGTSSIVYEAALSGIPVITLLDGVFSDETYLKELNGITGVYPVHPEELTDYIARLNHSQTVLEHGPYILKAFQFERVEDIITHF